MSDPVPPGDDPFGGIPFMGELMKMFQGRSGGGDVARQLARTIANDGQTEPNVEPVDRMAVEELVRVAELQVASATGLAVSRGGPLTVEVGNRGQWADRTIDDYRPLFETLSSSMAAGLVAPDDVPTDDPMAAMLAGIGQMMGPMMLGMTTGSMVGHLARRALGGHDLPVPRPVDAPVLVLLRNVDFHSRFLIVRPIPKCLSNKFFLRGEYKLSISQFTRQALKEVDRLRQHRVESGSCRLSITFSLNLLLPEIGQLHFHRQQTYILELTLSLRDPG